MPPFTVQKLAEIDQANWQVVDRCPKNDVDFVGSGVTCYSEIGSV